MEGQFPCRTAASAGYCVAPTPAAPLLLPVLELSSGLWCWATRRPVSIILGVGSYFCGSTAGSWVFAPGCWERWGGPGRSFHVYSATSLGSVPSCWRGLHPFPHPYLSAVGWEQAFPAGETPLRSDKGMGVRVPPFVLCPGTPSSASRSPSMHGSWWMEWKKYAMQSPALCCPFGEGAAPPHPSFP